MTRKWYATLRHPKMYPHTKFGIPTSKNIGNMDRTRKRDRRTDGRTDSAITICLPKFLWGHKNIDITKATGSDNIGARLLKLAAPFISDSLMYICNQSILNSTFPDKWKEGKVRPLYKNGPKDDTNNYRPISILPVMSKMLEKTCA